MKHDSRDRDVIIALAANMTCDTQSQLKLTLKKILLTEGMNAGHCPRTGGYKE